jgi:hypothetical protein
VSVKILSRSIAACALLFLCLLTAGYGQTPDTATLTGKVVDQTKATIAGATVTIKNLQTGIMRTGTSDDAGRFSMAGVPVTGVYEIAVEKAGFQDAKLKEVTLVGGATATFNFEMRTTGQTTDITVTGTAGEIRTDTPQLGVDLGEEKIQETPLPNRRITYLPLLNSANRPAIGTGDVFINQNLFTTNGAGRRQAGFVVDGSTGLELWGRQTIFTSLPVDSLQEMTVLTNAFSAEYGAGVGSVVNIVSRTGGNNYHGSVIGVLRPAALTAQLSRGGNAASGTQIRSDYLKQFAATLGGPIGESGNTHFFLDGEYSWQNRTSPVTSAIAPGNFVGHYRGWLGFARLDHRFSDRNNAFLRLGADSFRDTNPSGAVGGNSLPSVGRIFRRRTYTTEVGETAVLSNSVINNARAQFSLASPVTAFDPFIMGTQYSVVVSALSATFTSGTSQAAKLQNRQFDLSDTVAVTRGRHALKFGADVIHAHNGGNGKEFGGPSYMGTLTFKPCAATNTVAFCESTYLADIDNLQTYSQSFGIGSYTVDDTLWSMFAQDDIRVTQGLTVNLGLRYERQTFTDATKNFAPRVGFAYDPMGDGKTALRGGYGIYYSQIPDNAAAAYALGGPTGVFTFSVNAGQIGFPTSLSQVPYTTFPAGGAVPVRSIYIRPGMASYYNQFFDTSLLKGYQDELLNPYSQQWTLGVERELAPHWVLSADYVGSHTIRINRPLDVNPPSTFARTAQGQTRTPAAANCTRPTWIAYYAAKGTACGTNPQPPYSLIQSDVNNGYANYNAFTVNLNHRWNRRVEMLASYTWSHALDNVDPDIPQQNPNDPNLTGAEEYADAIFDQRHRFVLSGTVNAPFKFNVGGVATLGSGLPYNITTGVTNSGDNGATTDRPIVNGAVLRRNAGRGSAIYEVSPFVERPIQFTEHLALNLRAEAFNILNHPNFVGYNAVYGNTGTPSSTMGTPGTGITAQLPGRSFQFQAKLSF